MACARSVVGDVLATSQRCQENRSWAFICDADRQPVEMAHLDVSDDVELREKKPIPPAGWVGFALGASALVALSIFVTFEAFFAAL